MKMIQENELTVRSEAAIQLMTTRITRIMQLLESIDSVTLNQKIVNLQLAMHLLVSIGRFTFELKDIVEDAQLKLTKIKSSIQ
jgi:hypothetical protein